MEKPQATSSTPSPIATSTQTPSPSPQPDSFREAVSKAIKVAVNVQSAKSLEDWNEIARQWMEVIDLLKTVPSSSSNYEIAQKKIMEYQKNLDYATQQVSRLDPFNQATEKAKKAANLTQIAKSYDQWNQVLNLWQEAIALLNTISESHPKSSLARQKSTEYKTNLDYSQQQVIKNDPFSQGMAKAEEAVQLQPYAILEADWNQVARSWQQAINFLKNVSQNHPQKDLANQKISEYSKNLTYAKQQANSMRQAAAVAIQSSSSIPEPAPQPSPPKPPASNQKPSPPKPPASNQKSSPPKPSNSNQKPNQLPPSNSARDFLEDYLNDVVNKGNYGYGYWCKSSKDLVSRLYSPRNYQILDVNDYSNKASAVVRIDSSTKGGFAVTQNWNFYLDQEAGKWCLTLIMEQ
ncbi:hypothetical protein L2E65_05540 [Planktothrix agardhii 1801]|uniref:hypothetical protein n=1 Tax=Planktothrix agardhii TaxID=1160 RepID=UPI001F206E64|nr:hypothetical protein [Planktothrix agardhii]MCF3624255.1 hypothetical protein [Planktothrix agardhii 1801]